MQQARNFGIFNIFALAAAIGGCASIFKISPNCVLAELSAEDQADPESIAHIRCRAINGNNDAEFRLAELYESGGLGKVDMEQAILWYTRAYKDDRVYLTPGAIPGNPPSSPERKWFSPGEKRAALALGKIYLEGRGVEQSDRRARKWLRRAAREGIWEAEEILAEMDQREVKEIGG